MKYLSGLVLATFVLTIAIIYTHNDSKIKNAEIENFNASTLAYSAQPDLLSSDSPEASVPQVLASRLQ